MKQLTGLSIALVALILLFLLLPLRLLPQLPPSGDRGLCLNCHWGQKDLAVHQGFDYTDESCLRCHNPHTHFGKPYLPSIDSCMICHFEYKAKAGYHVHLPVREGQCSSCHRPHRLFEKSELTVGIDMLCYTCHRDEMLVYEEPVGHMPYEKGQCLSCHEAHMTEERGLLRQPLTVLCQSCHRMADEWTRPVQHMPFERGLCMDCHLPHASGWRGLTRLDQAHLCYSCHKDREREMSRPVKHGPYGEGDCTACHEPHSSVGADLLPEEREEEFCFLCHDNIKQLGWYGSPHDTVYEGGKVCLSCHQHHSAQYPFLSRAPLDGRGNLCLFCHDQIGENYFLSAHAFLRCGQCHQIHGSPDPYLLDAKEMELCIRCHPGMLIEGRNHPVGEPFINDLTGRMLGCSSCHGPHGTTNTKMRLRTGNDLCMPCHNNIH